MSDSSCARQGARSSIFMVSKSLFPIRFHRKCTPSKSLLGAECSTLSRNGRSSRGSFYFYKKHTQIHLPLRISRDIPSSLASEFLRPILPFMFINRRQSFQVCISQNILWRNEIKSTQLERTAFFSSWNDVIEATLIPANKKVVRGVYTLQKCCVVSNMSNTLKKDKFNMRIIYHKCDMQIVYEQTFSISNTTCRNIPVGLRTYWRSITMNCERWRKF